jgi:hypothetical protein
VIPEVPLIPQQKTMSCWYVCSDADSVETLTYSRRERVRGGSSVGTRRLDCV